MPTDDSAEMQAETRAAMQARRLLARAAETIEVDPAAPLTLAGLPEPQPRRWPVLAAAAAVVLLIGGGFLVSRQLGDDPSPAPAPAIDHTTDAVPADQLPGLIGLTQEEATRLLEERGLAVQVTKQPEGCNVPDTVVGSTPPVGAHVDAGDTVTIRVIRPQQVIDCVGDVPWHYIWDIVRYARGIGDAPESLAEASVDDDVLERIAAMLDQSWPQDASPFVAARWPSGSDICGGGRDTFSGDLRFWVEIPIDGPFCPAQYVDVELGSRGIDAVRFWEPTTITTDELEPTLERLTSAQQFVKWARGTGPAPAFADRVRVMFLGGGAFGSTGWVDDPEGRGYYSGCSGLGFPNCGLDPVAMIYNYKGVVVPTRGRSVCADGGEVPKRFAEAPEDVVRLEEPEPADCEHAWAVELWIDADGVIYGVNQAGAFLQY
ncbi:PASTA domain-containing protein [Nocardioides humilatus]|uniref:PASTA domain-containing protein n=1 Tax=Nocardioides humilatus TaxID=2607660 RepID=A0A5B1LNI1_9ACTN|nr:PASTA domain-containing protein [Nocardioides humilatus]KAA1421668.1 PASTA domain-containing protein [Nocardioides humilatus]